MRAILAVIALAFVVLAPSGVSAQPIVTSDPGRYAAELSNNMAVGGVGPLRGLYVSMFPGASLPTNIEATLLTYERAITSPRAMEAGIVEDVSLSNRYRSVYLCHYYGTNLWVFTRVDFVRISPTEWALTAAAFGSEWSSVAQVMTPSFQSNLGNRR
jgi:hypothetical protein